MGNYIYFWIGFLAYSIIVIWIGFYIWKKEKASGRHCDNSAYWSASGNLSGLSSGLSISASMMSISWSCVYGVQLFYWYGPGGAWLLIIPWLITMAGFFIFASRFRKFKTFSQPELLEKRFGSKARQLLAPALIVVFITWTGAEIYAAGNIIAPFLGISLNQALLIITIVVSVYTYTGGFEAVVSTDKIQFLLVAVFISSLAVIGWNALPAGTSIWDIPPPPKLNHHSNLFAPGIALIAVTFFAYLPGWLIETDVWIRLQAAKSNGAARRGILIAGINSFVFVGVMPLLIGMSALILFPPVNGIIPGQLQDGTVILTVLMQNYAPVWLNVFLSIGLIAAAMSTIDTCGNVVALSFSFDLVEPHVQNKWSAARLNNFARISSVGAVFISYIYAIFTDSLWDIFYLSSGILTTTVFIPVISSFFKSTQKSQVHFSIVFGFLSTLIFYFLESRGNMGFFEPSFLSGTGLSYILWGFIFSIIGFFTGKLFSGSGAMDERADL